MEANSNNITFDTSDRHSIVELMKKYDPGIYTTTTVDGNHCLVCIGKSGVSIKVILPEKPNWYQVVDFDSDGYREADRVEPVK